MKIISIVFDQKSGEVFNLDRIPEIVLARISSYYLLKRRFKMIPPKQRSEIAKIAARRSAEVRSEKARLGTLKKYVRKSQI